MIDLKAIPTNPGCYIYKNSNGKIIYIGKAKNLKKRVSSYFQKTNHDIKTASLVKHIHNVEFMITDSEVEALLLENNLIKKYRPKYNIDLKDSKRYAYLRLTEEAFPKLLLARDQKEKGEYFGPFVSASERNALKEFIVRTFKLRTCKRFPKKACLRYHIDLCDAPCISNISEEDYKSNIENARTLLKGKSDSLQKQLKKNMDKASKEQEFEKAIQYRNQINSLEYLQEKQKVERKRIYNEDVISFQKSKDKIYLLIFHVYKGVLANKQEFELPNKENFLEEFLIQYYTENNIPKEIILPVKISEPLHQALEKERKSKVIITVPKVGEKKKLIQLVNKNIELTFFAKQSMLNELQIQLNLESPPTVMECFDISHLSGTDVVASMVQFTNGMPNKSGYRKFKIKSFVGNDDFKAIAEVVRRRYTRLKLSNIPYPDLIIIDGGKGQLSSAVAELKKLNLRIPIVSLAKKEEEVFTPNESEPLIIAKNNKGLQLLKQIRDEAHRFAITYNKLLRKKKLFDKVIKK